MNDAHAQEKKNAKMSRMCKTDEKKTNSTNSNKILKATQPSLITAWTLHNKNPNIAGTISLLPMGLHIHREIDKEKKIKRARTLREKNKKKKQRTKIFNENTSQVFQVLLLYGIQTKLYILLCQRLNGFDYIRWHERAIMFFSS